MTLLLNDNEILALVNSGSTSSSFIDKLLVHQFDIKVISAKGEIECVINFTLTNCVYENIKVLVMGNLFADIILGQDFMERHK